MTFLNAPHSSDLATDSAEAAPHIAGAHGYRLDGDQITLWAEVAGGPAEVSLALWAQPAETTDTASRILVAQIRCRLHGAGVVLVEGEVPAAVPSGQADWQMVLTLSAPDAAGQVVERDARVFAMTQSFLQPTLVVDGPLVARPVVVGLQIDSVAVTNPRPADNLSGSLCLELWALAEAYTGGTFAGQCLGTIPVGQLGGQSGCDCLGETWAVPADAAAVLVLMLREWTQDGLLTRDHRVVTLAVEEVPAPAPAPEPAPAKVAAPVPAPAPVVKPKARPSHLLNVNLATEEQLVAIDGLNRALAKAVVAARPFASMDDLLDIKGVGDKRLARMRRHLGV
ncbi:helix-hairpin-helix domain-containing protein [uncultured Sphaerotilus sp.]|uniref:ComEA family DNA-binding protein n=1 Tax=uncultured Sphaerotilus sp. TaxID=474984 RepID=UPI0030CA37FC